MDNLHERGQVPLSETARAASLIVNRFSEHALEHQNARIAEIREMSAAMEAALEDFGEAASNRSQPRDEVAHSRDMIVQSRELIERACAAGESSTKRIARSRELMSRWVTGRPGS